MLAELLAFGLAFAPWGVLAGLCFALAGLVGVIVLRRRDLTLGPPPVDIPTVIAPAPFPGPTRPPTVREDADTGVIPRIPGATAADHAARERYLAAVDEAIEQAQVVCDEIALVPIDGLREERIDEVPDEVPVEVIERVAAGLGFTYSPPDECPLTTGEIEIPVEGDGPIASEVAAFRNRRQETQDLTANLNQILGRERVS